MRIETHQGTVRFAVHVQPRASRTELVGWHEDAVKVRVAAPPVEGAANAELLALLAKKLGVPKSAIRILTGERGRRKLVEVKGVAAEHAMARLSRPC